MSHLFGDLLSQHLHRKHGLSQSKLAAGILQDPSIITAMSKGKRLSGSQARERVIAIISWLHEQGVLETVEEANRLLDAAGLAALSEPEVSDIKLLPLQRTTTNSAPASGLASLKTNLPSSLTSFIGREHAIDEVRRLLAEHRLVTLTGSGGVGKTRLAVEVGLHIVRTAGLTAPADGVWLIELAPLADATLVAHTIANIFQIPDTAGRARIDLLQDALADKDLLLILDNCEHLIEACAEVAERLLQRCWRLRILATSRETLRIPGEAIYRVPSLETPETSELTPMNLMKCASTRLFVERVRVSQPRFEIRPDNAMLIAKICSHLGGIPLALELTAPLVKSMALDEMEGQLSHHLSLLVNRYRTATPRHRTMRNALDWSYNLLTPEEQTLFRRLGIFAGGWTLDAAKQVAATEGLGTPIIDLMQSLADKSLIKIETRGDELHGSMLETVREYAMERLEQSDESEALRKRHAYYFAAYAESIEPPFSVRRRSSWAEQLQRERTNLTLALAEARRTDDVELQIRFIATMHPLLARLLDPDRWTWLSTLFARPEARANPFAYAKAIYGSVDFLALGHFAHDDGQPHRLEHAASLFESLGETVWQAASLASLGMVVSIEGLYARAQAYCAQSIRLFKAAGHPELAANALTCLAGVHRDQGRYTEAERLFKQAQSLFGELQDDIDYGMVMIGLGELECDRGNFDAAQTYFEAALASLNGTVWRELPHWGTGQVSYMQSHLLEASWQFEACVADARFWGNTELLMLALPHLAFVRQLLGDEAQALTHLHESLTLQHEHKAGRIMPGGIERAAWIAADQGLYRRAARLLGAADAMRQRLGAPLPLGEKPLYDHYLEETRVELVSIDFGTAWDEGVAMPLDQVVAYVLSASSATDAITP